MSSLQQLGNNLFKLQKYEEAIEIYTQALSQDSNNIKLYGNRSQCLINFSYSLQDQNQIKQILDLGIQDADQCITLDKSWNKGYFRKAKCLELLNQIDEAIQTLSIIEDKELLEYKKSLINSKQNHQQFMDSLGKYAYDNKIMPNMNDLEQWKQDL